MSSCMVVVVKHPIAYRNRTRSSPKWQPTWIDPSTSTAASTWAHLPNCYSHQQRLLQSSLHHQQPLHPRQLQARLSSYQKKVNKLCLFLLRNCFACILFYGTMPYSLGNCWIYSGTTATSDVSPSKPKRSTKSVRFADPKKGSKSEADEMAEAAGLNDRQDDSDEGMLGWPNCCKLGLGIMSFWRIILIDLCVRRLTKSR